MEKLTTYITYSLFSYNKQSYKSTSILNRNTVLLIINLLSKDNVKSKQLHFLNLWKQCRELSWIKD